ncbi:MAG: ATP-dependent helicase HrpB, partial [Acidimicrobiia bacterium]
MPLPDLPVTETLPELRSALAARRRAVLVAPPGAGKTTIVPLALVDEDWLDGRRIVMLEPRRLATRAAARRMADLCGQAVGDLVGYQTRDERHIGPDTRIEVVTEGILTRRLQNDPDLPGVGLVIFDEVHERNLPTDLGLALALDAAATLRPDLGILAMSATADSASLATILGDAELGDAPVVASEGRTFPVDVRWVPRERRDRIDDVVVRAVHSALRDETGDLLVFLPGIGEIMRAKSTLESSVGPDVDVYPLAGALSLAEQDLALSPSPPGRRRVVLSTDIAETSLTVDGVRVVVDSGLARAPRFDTRTGMTRLTTITTSRSSAEQRAGRAGRTEPGVCYRLWSKIEHGSRAAHRTPEIDDVDLSGLVLEVAAWGTPLDALAFPTPPPPKAVRAGEQLLHDLGALDADGRLTEIGRRMLGLPVHPRLARMLVAEPSPLGCALAV